MEIKVKLSNLRTAPKKVRMVADLIRGKNLMQAQQILSFTVNKSARPVLKLLNSAKASAVHDFQLDELNLFVSHIMVDEGPKLKRWHPMSRGRAYPILKRTSQIVLILSEINPTIKEARKESRGDVKETKKLVKTKEKKGIKKPNKKTKKKI
jgi:large subunit ribosomal protein L22